MEFSDHDRLFLAAICDHFHEKAEWPTYGFLRRRLRQHESLDVRSVGQALERFMFDAPYVPMSVWDSKQKVTLSIRALHECQVDGIYPALNDDLDAFMQIVRLCIEKYDAAEDEEGESPEVTEAEVRLHFDMSDLMLAKVFLLIQLSGLTGSLGYNEDREGKPKDWRFTVGPAIYDYRRIRTIEDYLQKRQELFEQSWLRATGVNNILAASLSYGDSSGAEEVATNEKDVFIVYGHDRSARFEVAHYIQSQLGLRAIMLDEIPEALSMGVFEAVEKYAESAGFAIVIMTPDDLGAVQGSELLYGRARQNVLIELGYFWHKLGRRNIVILKKGEVEIPSDFAGILYAQMDEPGAWREKVRAKVQASGLVGNVADSA